MSDVIFKRLRPSDLLCFEPQPSQRTQYGVPTGEMSIEEAEAHASMASSWTAWAGERAIACMGILETFPGQQGLAWTWFAEGIGRHHLAVTRFARDEIVGKSRLPRIEAIVRCVDVEPLLEILPDLGRGELLAATLERNFRSPEVRWAIAVGLEPVHVLRKYGAASETHMLLERIR